MIPLTATHCPDCGTRLVREDKTPLTCIPCSSRLFKELGIAMRSADFSEFKRLEPGVATSRPGTSAASEPIKS